MSMLRLEKLQVRYGSIEALRGIDLHVEPGETITLIGANGAGKTTTMNAIVGLVPACGGQVFYQDKDVTRTDTKEKVRDGMILSPEGRQIFPGFTVRENLMMGAYLRGKGEAPETLETVLELFPRLRERLAEGRKARGLPPVELRLDGAAARIIPGRAAGAEDFHTEFLDYILAVKVVDDLDGACAHIAAHSTGHSEAIVTGDETAARRFTALVDSAAVYWNASTRFTDGGEFGLGCEMGISTQRLHARGPMGLQELCCYKYVIRGTGQVR